MFETLKNQEYCQITRISSNVKNPQESRGDLSIAVSFGGTSVHPRRPTHSRRKHSENLNISFCDVDGDLGECIRGTIAE